MVATTHAGVILYGLFSLQLILVSGQWIRGSGEMLLTNVSSDYMYRFRVAVTPLSNFVYAIDASSGVLAQFTINRTARGLLSPSWTAVTIPAVTEKQPVINVDSSTDRAYLVHPVDGKIYCYDATKGTDPLWTTSFVCSLPSSGRNQHHQTFTANGERLLARCNDSIVLLNGRGQLLKTFASSNVKAFAAKSDLAAPIPVINDFKQMLTWYTRTDPGTGTNRSFLEVWALTGKRSRPETAKSTIVLPAGVAPSGVNADAGPWIVVVDDVAPVVHVLSYRGGKLRSSYDFKQLVDPVGALQVSVLPSPIIVDSVMYGVVQGKKSSPLDWLPDLFPPEFYWWMFALSYENPRAPELLWITDKLRTRGPLAPQVPWVTDPAVFITDYQQNGTYGFYRCCGTKYFNVPFTPGVNTLSAYSLIRGTYKISHPWVSRDGLFEIIQYDNWMYDTKRPEDRDEWDAVGYIRTMVGSPVPPMPPKPSLPPPSR